MCVGRGGGVSPFINVLQSLPGEVGEFTRMLKPLLHKQHVTQQATSLALGQQLCRTHWRTCSFGLGDSPLGLFAICHVTTGALGKHPCLCPITHTEKHGLIHLRSRQALDRSLSV